MNDDAVNTLVFPTVITRAESALTGLLGAMRRSGSPIAHRRYVEELLVLLPTIEKGLK